MGVDVSAGRSCLAPKSSARVKATGVLAPEGETQVIIESVRANPGSSEKTEAAHIPLETFKFNRSLFP